jgi:hypothetical protein
MLFTLEALNARKGDCLLVHYGDRQTPRLVVIDGGPADVYASSLRPRLQQILGKRHKSVDDPLDVELVMVSHIDDDHIVGILDWFAELEQAQDGRPYNIRTLWLNSFDDIAGNTATEIQSRVATVAATSFNPDVARSRDSAAIIASIPQGRKLRDSAVRLAIGKNDGFSGMVMAQSSGSSTAKLQGGLSLRVLCPDRARLTALATEWDKAKKKDDPAVPAAFVDKSVTNLSSIVVLAEVASGNKKRSMLLTGDARGDDILAALKASKLLKNDRMAVDVLKLPHHGSNRNLAPEFFETVLAKHYVISANGEHENPDKQVIEWIAKARGADPYTIYITNEKLRDPKKRIDIEAIVKQAIRQTAKIAPKRKIVFRAEQDLSVRIDLLDPLPF